VKVCLVVDDSRVIRKVARRILEGLGFEVAEAGDGAEALGWLRTVTPHVILVDWNMPGMSGAPRPGARRRGSSSGRRRTTWSASARR
jgi:CheY-like chemotaxis protein